MAKAKKRKITAEDLYRFELITDMHMSPDGKHIVYSIQRVEKNTEKKHSNLWVVPTSGGSPKQFTHGNQVDMHPRWSPDGRSIAFISNRGDERQMQIFIIPFGGGEASKLTNLKGTIGGFVPSPDGKQFALTFRKKDKELVEIEGNEQKKKLGIVARHYDRPFFKADGAGFMPKERWHLWTVDAKSGKAKQITDSEVFDEYDPQWSPDSKHILFTSNRTDEPDLHPYDDEFYIIPCKGGRIKQVNTHDGSKHLPAFSPDGKWIAYMGIEAKRDWWRNTRIYLSPVSGKGKTRCLTINFDFDSGAKTVNDIIGALHYMRPVWSADGKSIYFQVSRHGDTLLKRVSVEGQRPAVEDVVAEKGVIGAFGFDRQHTKLGYYFGDMTSPGQLFVRNMKTAKTRKLTRVNDNFLNRINLGDIEEVWFKGSSKNDLQGWIIKPPNFNPRRKYPAILEIHGGPLVQYGNLFMHEFYYLAAAGYVVFFCNPRGGQGYGEKHARAIKNNWGTVDYDDLMAWANYVVRKKYVDKDRVGVTGGSYGGYMTNWIIGHTNRFKAAVTQRCVSNLISFWGTSDFNWIFQDAFGGKPPWEDMNNLWRQSPMKYMGNAKTPTLVIHSEADHRAAIEQGEQMFVALKTQGIDSELVRFPDEPHGLSRGGRTDRRIKRLEYIRGWFDKYLRK
jgi:dipeptidyl aminopeptidase/acylaminoacyl peptidase